MEEAYLAPGAQVADVACGTGPTLRALSEAVEPTGQVIAIDGTRPMLDRAQARTADATNIVFVHARWPDVEVPQSLDAAICCFGLSVMEDWRHCLDRMVDAVRPGGRVVVVDWLADPAQNPLTRHYIQLGAHIFAGDSTRPIAAEAAARLADAEIHRLPIGLTVVAGTAA